jgi:hypothetical protein
MRGDALAGIKMYAKANDYERALVFIILNTTAIVGHPKVFLENAVVQERRIDKTPTLIAKEPNTRD